MPAPAFYNDAFPIVPDDNNDLARIASAIVVGGATGTLKVTTAAGRIVSFPGVVAGTVLPLRVKKVFAAGTSATNLIALLADG